MSIRTGRILWSSGASRPAPAALAATRRGLSAWSNDSVPTGSVATLHELGVAAGEAYGDLKSLGTRKDGAWVWTTFAERAARADALGNALASYGVERGDRVAVISKNREEFVATMYGAYAAGAAHVPMYEQQKPEEWEYILNDSEAKVVFVSTAALLPSAREAARKYGKKVLCFEDLEAGSEHNFAEALDYGATLDGAAAAAQRPGAELTHDNLVWNCTTMRDLMREEMGAIGHYPTAPVRSLAILPWAHIYGQTIELHGMTAAGHEVAVATDPTTFLAEVAEAKPDCLFAVPALYNRAVALGAKKARSRLTDADGSSPPPLTLVESLQHFVLDKLVLSKVRDKLGGKLLFAGNGGAALSKEVRDFMDACGVPMTNGYGLTETSPVLTKEKPLELANDVKGSIGVALPGVGVKVLDADGAEVAPGEPGELCASGRGVMRGYWKNPEATAEVLFEDGGETWFRTGDQCVVDASGHVRIVGRIKEQYKLANGKYVVPTPLEEQLARSRYVAQAFLTATTALQRRSSPSTGSPSPEVREGRPRGRDRAHSSGFKNFELPEKFAILTEGFNLKRGMVTPKMSVKRPAVFAAHEADVTPPTLRRLRRRQPIAASA
ncbi:decanoate-CoA ligase [Aureococcus anophagefferens]|nr:decanoate-CoA ligase [Aureococcus anophagefferens]